MQRQRSHRKVVSSVRWAFIEGILSAVFTFATTLAAARFIAPNQFGEAAIVIAVASIVEATLLSGIINTLIRAPSFDTRESDAFFCLTLALGLAAAGLCCALAIPLSLIYDSTGLIPLMLVQSLTCICAGAISVPNVILSRKMRVKALATRTFGQKVITLVVTATLAWQGAGAWAVVIGAATGIFFGAIILIASLSRAPKLRPEWKTCLPTISLARAVTLEMIAGIITPRIVMLLFGVFHGVEAAGLLNFAVRLVDELSNILKTVVYRTALPLFGLLQRKGGDPVLAFQTGARLICLVSSPVLLGVAAVSPTFIPLVFGAHWVPAIYAVQVVALTWAIAFARVLIGPLLLAKGIQGPQTFNSWFALTLSIVAGVITAPISFPEASWAYAVPALGSLPIGIYLANKIGGIPTMKQLQPVVGPIAFSSLMALAVFFVGTRSFGDLNALSSLLAQVGLGAALYSTYLVVFNGRFLREILMTTATSRGA